MFRRFLQLGWKYVTFNCQSPQLKKSPEHRWTLEDPVSGEAIELFQTKHLSPKSKPKMKNLNFAMRCNRTDKVVKLKWTVIKVGRRASVLSKKNLQPPFPRSILLCSRINKLAASPLSPSHERAWHRTMYARDDDGDGHGHYCSWYYTGKCTRQVMTVEDCSFHGSAYKRFSATSHEWFWRCAWRNNSTKRRSTQSREPCIRRKFYSGQGVANNGQVRGPPYMTSEIFLIVFSLLPLSF